MTIELPDKDIGSLRLTSEQARVELAVGLYAGQQTALGRARRIAGISSTAFMYEIGRRGLCINYTAEDALTDVETVRQRLGR